MQVEIVGALQTQQATSQKGKAYTRREQEAYIHKANEKYPLKARIRVPETVKDGYAMGRYDVDWDQSIKVNGYGDLEFAFALTLGKKVA